MPRLRVRLRVNGVEHELEVGGGERLIDTLRNRLNIKSVKEGCSTGDCGTCTVLMDGEPINSCITLTAQANGREITTLEGIGRPGDPHPLQITFAELAATQCGYCIPGIIMAAKSLLDRNPNPSGEEVRWMLAGHLCRCTGYSRIVEAVLEAARILRSR